MYAWARRSVMYSAAISYTHLKCCPDRPEISGGALLQKMDRDTQKCAFKCCALMDPTCQCSNGNVVVNNGNIPILSNIPIFESYQIWFRRSSYGVLESWEYIWGFPARHGGTPNTGWLIRDRMPSDDMDDMDPRWSDRGWQSTAGFQGSCHRSRRRWQNLMDWVVQLWMVLVNSVG